jgi:hypothetical protein
MIRNREPPKKALDIIMTRLKVTLLASAVGLVALGGAGTANAVPVCLANPTCTLDGENFTTQGTGVTSLDGLNFIVQFQTGNQGHTADIAKEVEDYLALLGYSNVEYLGRAGGILSSGIVSITATPNGGLTGTWSLNPGTTGLVGAFVAIHAGEGQTDDLFSIDAPGTSGTWATNNGHGLSNFDLFGVLADPVPEPMSLGLLGVGVLGLGLTKLRRRCA